MDNFFVSFQPENVYFYHWHHTLWQSTTYKTQVQSPTGQGRSTLRYWAFSDSYPFQQ
jgi:hypothetical protein